VVTLKYAETNAGNGLGSRVFNVTLEGATVLTSFDVLAHAAHNQAFDETFNVTVVGSALTIHETIITGNPILNAILVKTP